MIEKGPITKISFPSDDGFSRVETPTITGSKEKVMTDMVERVARAIGKAEMGDAYFIGLHWNMNAPNRSRLCNMSYAAIQAMREPTEAMVETGESVRGNHLSDYPDNGTKSIFSAMIDAALGKTEGEK